MNNITKDISYKDIIELNNILAGASDLNELDDKFIEVIKKYFSPVIIELYKSIDGTLNNLNLFSSYGIESDQYETLNKIISGRVKETDFSDNSYHHFHIKDSPETHHKSKIYFNKNIVSGTIFKLNIDSISKGILIISYIDEKIDFEYVASNILLLINFYLNYCLKLEQLKSNNKLYHLLGFVEKSFEKNDNGIIITNPNLPDNPSVFVNSAFSKITGYTKEEALGKNCRFLQGKFRNQNSLSLLRQAIRDRESCSVVLKNQRKDGSTFWNQLHIIPMLGNGNKVAYFIGIQIDISSKINAEEKLNEINTRFRTLISNLQSGILIEDENRRIILVNEEFLKMFGIPLKPDDLIMTDCSNSAEESKGLFIDSEIFVKRIDQILKEQIPVKNELVYLKDGRVFERDYIPIFFSDAYKGHLWNYRDITERIETENNLLELARFPVEVPSPIIKVNDNSEIIFNNAYADTILDNLGISTGSKLPAPLLAAFQSTLKSSSTTEIELKIKNRYYNLIFTKALNTNYVNIYGMDSTNKKTIQLELNELKLFYEQTLNDLPAEISVLDAEFRYLYVNPTKINDPEMRMWIIGKNESDYLEKVGIDKSSAHLNLMYLRKAQSEKSIVKYEESVIASNNKEKRFLRIISPVLDQSNEATKFIVYAIDISDKYYAEVALKFNIEFENLITTISSKFINIDTDFIKDTINESLMLIGKYAGVDRSYIFEIDDTGNYMNNTFEWCEVNIEPQLENLQNIPVDFLPWWMAKIRKFETIHLPDVQKLPSEASAEKEVLESQEIKSLVVVPMIFNNSALGFVGFDSVKNYRNWSNETVKLLNLVGQIFTNALLRLRSENKIHALLNNLENSNKALSDFAYIASHDLREPLRKISSFGSLLLDSIGKKIPNDDLENLNYMIDGAKRMQLMIDDLLSYSRLSSGKKEFRRVDLDKVLTQIIDFELYELINETHAEIKTFSALGSVYGEETQIKQVLQNLLNNSIKYHKPGITPLIEIRTSLKNNFVIVEIEDNGIGIEEKYHKQVFEMFKRLHSRDKYPGSGIGLAICKKIIENHSGEIGIISKSGEGTIFWFKLPEKKV